MTSRIPAKQFEIIFTEGTQPKTPFTSLEALRAYLWRIVRERDASPADVKNGSILKTQVIATFADGNQAGITLPIGEPDALDRGTDFASRLVNQWLFYAGLRKPAQMTDEAYARHLQHFATESKRGIMVWNLQTYDLGNANVNIGTDDQGNPVILESHQEAQEAQEDAAQLQTWTECPWNEFEALAGRLAGPDATRLAREMETLACRYAAAAEYLSTRFGLDGTGKHDHADAAKAANKAWKVARSIFGYTRKLQQNIIS